MVLFYEFSFFKIGEGLKPSPTIGNAYSRSCLLLLIIPLTMLLTRSILFIAIQDVHKGLKISLYTISFNSIQGDGYLYKIGFSANQSES